MASQEDDATELQFPKDVDTLYSNSVEGANELICSFCNLALQFPYIQCAICHCLSGKTVNLCPSCFAKGREFGFHKNDHDYLVMKNSPVFTAEWKAKEEMQFLNAIIECGLGNWTDVSKRLCNKSADDCKNHYLDFYVNYPCAELSTLVKENFRSTNKSHMFYPVLGTGDPPRPPPCSVLFRDMAGYNPARSEFTVEYLNDAESIVQDIDFSLFEDEEGPPIGQELQVTLIDIYRRQLGERRIRRKAIREHGLINPGKATVQYNYYKSALPKYSELIPVLYSLFPHEELVYFLESLCCEEELKCHIQELKECRINGLTKQAQVSIYETLKKKRENLKRKKHKLVLGTELSDVNFKELNILKSSSVGSLKRTTIPLDITGEMEYETLNQEEREISSSLRILPSKFNMIKYGMIEECRKLNGLQLRHARSQFKIDVNKIRKIYDYLLAEGLIYRPIPTK